MNKNNKKKVLILSHSSEIGGGELSMLDFFDYWAEKEEIKPFFIIKSPAKRLASQLKKRGWEYIALDYTSWTSRYISREKRDLYRNSNKNTKAVLKIDKIIKDFKPDVVMTNTIVAPWAAFAAKLNGLPHIWFVREYGDLDHGHKFETSKQETFSDIGLLSELVVTNSKALSDHVNQYITPKRAITLYTPFKVAKIREMSTQKTQSPYKDNDSLKIIMVGVVKPSKGQKEAIKAAGLLNEKGINVEIAIIGQTDPPEYANELKKLVNDLDISDKVHFLGKQPNPYKYIKSADLAIMASKSEAFGRVTFEYLCLGKPVVGAAKGGTLEMIKDELNGFLYSPGSYKDMVEKLERYSSNPQLLDKHSKNAAKTAEDMISGENSADKAISQINQAIKSSEVYKLPAFTKRWLNIPNTSRAPGTDLQIINRMKKAKELGPVGSYHRIKHKIKNKRNG